jgi:hypothetical protein
LIDRQMVLENAPETPPHVVARLREGVLA